jgi:hypothetical protein
MLRPDNPSIGVVLTVHKRPHLLKDQLTAIRRQSVPASEVVIWDNNAEVDYASPGLHGNESVVCCTKNWGVWPRFFHAQFLDTRFICVFDDDTLPGHDWLRNCLDTYSQLPPFSLVGGVGVTFPDGTRDNRLYWGWKNPSDTIVNVDLVGHAWFFERELLNWLVYDHRGGLTCGEDYAISATARKQGGCVVCPPHPKDQLSLWSSLRGFECGDDDVALYKQPGEEDRKAAVHQRLRDGGWPVVAEATINE